MFMVRHQASFRMHAFVACRVTHAVRLHQSAWSMPPMNCVPMLLWLGWRPRLVDRRAVQACAVPALGGERRQGRTTIPGVLLAEATQACGRPIRVRRMDMGQGVVRAVGLLTPECTGLPPIPSRVNAKRPP